MSDFKLATDFRCESLKIEGKELKPMFFGFELFESLFITAMSGTLTVVDTTDNQQLAEMKLEGNEEIELEFNSHKGRLSFHGWINRIINKIETPNGSVTYAFEVCSSVVRENEQQQMTKRFNNQKPKDIVEEAIEKLNSEADIPIEKDKIEGVGKPMNFIAARWKPIRVISYVLNKGVPMMRRGTTTASDDVDQREIRGEGTASFLFWETLKGLRFGSSVEVMEGKVGQQVSGRLEYMVQKDLSLDESTNSIYSFDVDHNNDTQTQTRAGAFKSKLVSFDMDKLHYKEQDFESEMATDKQKKTSKKPTRVFSKLFVNECYENSCDKAPPNRWDQSREYLQQGQSTINNVSDGIAHFTLPIRPDINAGDLIDTTVYETSIKSSKERDKKFSGNWIVSGVAHHYRMEDKAAYTRLTCMRATNQQDEFSAGSV